MVYLDSPLTFSADKYKACLRFSFACCQDASTKTQTEADKPRDYHLNVALHTAPQDLLASERRDPKGKSSDREHSVTPLECDRAQANRGTPIDHEKLTPILDPGERSRSFPRWMAKQRKNYLSQYYCHCDINCVKRQSCFSCLEGSFLPPMYSVQRWCRIPPLGSCDWM